MTANLAGSYDGKAWDPAWTAATRRNRYFIEKLDDYTPRDLPGSINGASCSAHWFTVRRRHGRDRLLRPGHAHPRRVRPDRHQAGRLLPRPGRSRPRAAPRRSSANNASAAYWHNGYIYVADYTRGIDVLRYTDPIKGVVQPKVCWNACDDSQTPAKVTDDVTGGAGGTVAGHAGADDGHAGHVRRVHAGRREGLHGLDDGQRHLDGR